MDTPDKHTLSLARDVINLRKDILQLMASSLALTETLISLAKATAQQDPAELLNRIVQITQKHHQALLSGIENTSPTLASILDDRTEDEVDGATS